MKKSLFFAAAASALLLTACSSENDLIETGPQKTVENQAVGFDVYTPAATDVTRAGLQGTMTTGRLQRAEGDGGGFGVYAYLTEDATAASGDENGGKYNSASPGKPNFMVNEKLLWNATNQGWYYNPLKYWPNETDNDSQNTNAEMEGDGTNHHLDRLSFFAYAPYVSAGAAGDGITAITANSSTEEPQVSYQAAKTDPNAAVDLLWGVAPAGGLSYTAVNGRTVTVAEGMPLIDMTKPDVNTSMKFLFNHALARIGIKAVAAVDQVGAGGKLDPNTKITIKEITLTGLFGTTGILNLDNTVANKANWISLNGVALSGNPAITALEGVTAADRTLTLNVGNGTISEHLRWVDDGDATPDPQTDRVGVTTVKQDVIEPSKPGASTRLWTTYKEYAAGEKFDYSETTPYYLNDENCAVGNLAAAAVIPATGHQTYTINNAGVITLVATPTNIKYPAVNEWYDGLLEKPADDAAATAATNAGKQAYTLDDANGNGTPDEGETFTPMPVGTAVTTSDYIITADLVKASVKYTSPAANSKYYKRDANYFMVVPTKNFENSSNITTEGDLKKLRTIRVKIEYYITTEDSKLAAGRAQTKNVIEKDVLFPSLENGKSYNLNLILGLTSVKMEAEVDDWKVINVNADLPQNTAE